MLHKQFGRQFKVEEYEEVLPDSIDGIVKYLSTGIIHGIGPVTAKKIVAAFGDKTLDIMDNHIERLKEIEGIGEKKFEIIYESYVKQKDLKDIMIYFQGHGMTPNQCIKIYKKFGPLSMDAHFLPGDQPDPAAQRFHQRFLGGENARGAFKRPADISPFLRREDARVKPFQDAAG